MNKRIHTVVIYHSHCADGFTAAWVASRFFGEHPGVMYHPAKYGESFPTACKEAKVYVLDFSFDLERMKQLCEIADGVIMFDHHKTAKDTFDYCKKNYANFHGTFDLEKSGALITWESFFPYVPAPKLVQHVSDRDLWNFKLPKTREISAAIFSHEYTFDNWDHLHDMLQGSNGHDLVIREGEAIERKHHKDVAELVNLTKFRVKLLGYNVWCCNIPYIFSSDAGHLLCSGQNSSEPFAMCYWDEPEFRVFSLRSNKVGGIDVSEIAKKFGGGGHKNASGFKVRRSASILMEDSLSIALA